MKKSIIAISLTLIAGSALACHPSEPNCPATGTTSSSTGTSTGAQGYVDNGVSVSVQNGGSAYVVTSGYASSKGTAVANADTSKSGDCCKQAVNGTLNGNTTSEYNAGAGVIALTNGPAVVNGGSQAGASSFGNSTSTINGSLGGDNKFALTVGSGAGAGGSVAAGVNELGAVSGKTSTSYQGAAGIDINKCLGTSGGYVTKTETVNLPKAYQWGNADITSGANGAAGGSGYYNVGASYGNLKP